LKKINLKWKKKSNKEDGPTDWPDESETGEMKPTMKTARKKTIQVTHLIYS